MKYRVIFFFAALGGIGFWASIYFFTSPSIPTSKTTSQKKHLSSPAIVVEKPLQETKQNLDNKSSPPEKYLEIGREEILFSIAQIEAQLENSYAIDRLNQNAVTVDERTKIGKQLQELDRLREREIALTLAELEADVLATEKTIATRLETYGIKSHE